MIESRSASFCLLIVLAASLTTVARALPDQPRIRTLTYDPARSEHVEIPPPPPGSAEGDLHAIRARIVAGDFRRALSGINGFIKRYGPDDPLYPDILVAKAECLIGRHEFDKADEVLREFLGEYSGVAATSQALRLQFEIAEVYLTGVRRKFLGIPMLSGKDRAYEILDEISAAYPQDRLAEYALKTKADQLFHAGEPALSELEYARLLRDYPQSRYHQFALRRAAEAALADFAGVDFDDAPLIEAQERYGDYRVRYPADADREGIGLLLDTIRERRAEKEFAIGRYYEKVERPTSAVFYYQAVLADWPGTVAAAKALPRLERLGVKSAAAPASTATDSSNSAGERPTE